MAIADNPQDPFIKSPLNPITNSGHETFLYPFREGIVAVTSHEGPEKIQYSIRPTGFILMLSAR